LEFPEAKLASQLDSLGHEAELGPCSVHERLVLAGVLLDFLAKSGV
jgi:hypothetical protein